MRATPSKSPAASIVKTECSNPAVVDASAHNIHLSIQRPNGESVLSRRHRRNEV